MGELGNGEELVRAFDHLPRGFDPQVVQQRHLGEQQLGHTAPEGRGVHHQDAGPGQVGGGLPEAGDPVSARRLHEIVDVARWHRHEREHDGQECTKGAWRDPRRARRSQGFLRTAGQPHL